MFHPVCLAGLLLLLLGTTDALFRKFNSGDCPEVDPMPKFKIEKFLGEWFVIENYNDQNVACLKENFSLVHPEANRPDYFDIAKYEIDQSEHLEEDEKILSDFYQVKRSYLPFGGRQILIDTGKVNFLKNDSQSEMEINYPYAETGMLNLKHYQVLATDYESYALVWRCQPTIFGHRRSAQIMSRKKVLSRKTIKELEAMISEVEEDVTFNGVKQTSCNGPLIDLEDSWDNKPIDKTNHNYPTIHNNNPKKKIPVNNDQDANGTNNNEDKFIDIGEKGIQIGNVGKVGGTSITSNGKNRKKLISIDVGGFHLSIHFPFW